MQDTYNSANNNNPDYVNFQRMARFGANIADAYGCYIFLPESEISGADSTASETLVLAGMHSLSNDVIKNCTIEVGHGLIGWVSKHKRSIHVSPFERDSRTLGLYHSDQALKSFIGIPIVLTRGDHQEIAGVIACDSKKSFAFSKLQGKLLEDLSCEISSQLRLASLLANNSGQRNNWQNFLNLTASLAEAIGRDSIDILRVKVTNYHALETALGSGRALAACEQLQRLVEQSIPANFPHIRFANGDLVIAADNMMTSFIENKITALAEHCAGAHTGRGAPALIKFKFQKESAGARKNRGLTIEELIQMTSENEAPAAVKKTEPTRNIGLIYEYKRA